jgi:hypothetical protein
MADDVEGFLGWWRAEIPCDRIHSVLDSEPPMSCGPPQATVSFIGLLAGVTLFCRD